MENDNTNNEQKVSQIANDGNDAWAEAMAEQKQAEEVEGTADDAWAEAIAEQKQAEEVADREQPSVSSASQDFEPAEFQNLEPNSYASTSSDPNLEMVLDIMVTISMEVGRTKISIRDLLRLNRGSVVELDRLVGDPLDVLVNGTLIAHGEVVMVKDKFGIRLTDVISPAERVRNLK